MYIDAVEVYRDDELVTVIEGENFESTPGFSQTIDSDGNVMGGVENVDIDGAWTPAAWNLWSVGFWPFMSTSQPQVTTASALAPGSDFSDGIAANVSATVSALDFSEETAGSQALRAQMAFFYLMLGEKR